MTATDAERAQLVRRWERATEWPLMVAAVVFLAAYAVPILDPDLPSWLLDLCRSLSWITWGPFVVADKDEQGRKWAADILRLALWVPLRSGVVRTTDPTS
jgi:hypothetical protein